QRALLGGVGAGGRDFMVERLDGFSQNLRGGRCVGLRLEEERLPLPQERAAGKIGGARLRDLAEERLAARVVFQIESAERLVEPGPRREVAAGVVALETRELLS